MWLCTESQRAAICTCVSPESCNSWMMVGQCGVFMAGTLSLSLFLRNNFSVIAIDHNCDMGTFGTRLHHARKAAGFSQALLAKKSGLSQATISDIERDRNSGSSEVVKLAKALDVSALWLADGLGPMRPGGANIDTPPEHRGNLPLISWVQAGALCESPDPFQPGDAEDWLPCHLPFGEGSFALRVVGESMMPTYRDGEVIYVDPTRAAKHGDDIVARTPDGRTTFKRLQKTPEGTFLLAINPDHPERIIRVPDDTHICGVVFASWMDRRR